MHYSISIVLPVYNEEQGIRSTLRNLVPVLKEAFLDYEVIIVESGSTDRSAYVADEEAKKNKKITVIHQGKKSGYGNAIREGLSRCKKDLSMYIDVDNPYDFRYLKKAVKYINGYDAVIGYKQGKRESFGRLALSKGANILAKIMFNLKAKDLHFPFKIIKTRFVKKMNLVSDHSFIAPEILIELKKQKARIKEIPVFHKNRREGESKFSDYKRVIINHLMDIIQYFRKNIWSK